MSRLISRRSSSSRPRAAPTVASSLARAASIRARKAASSNRASVVPGARLLLLMRNGEIRRFLAAGWAALDEIQRPMHAPYQPLVVMATKTKKAAKQGVATRRSDISARPGTPRPNTPVRRMTARRSENPSKFARALAFTVAKPNVANASERCRWVEKTARDAPMTSARSASIAGPAFAMASLQGSSARFVG